MKSLFNKTITALITVTMLSGMAMSFSDTGFKPYQDTLINQKIIAADDLKFADTVMITADFMTLLIKVLDPTTRGTQQLADATALLEKAKSLNLILEVDEVLHYMDKSLPRELAVQLLSRALDAKGEKITADPRLSVKFKDFNIVNDINREALLKTYQAGIIKGDAKGNLGAKNLVTKAEASVMVAKLMDKTLRTQLIISKNTKKYNEVAEWYLEQFEKTVTSKPVVIEKKAGGVLNSGDVDYTERAFYYKGKWNNWWTDQEFEDRVLGELTSFQNIYTTSLKVGERLDMTNLQGYYYPRNGEMNFTLHEGKRDGKALKHYNHPVKNMNRIAYDFAKYTAQMAFQSGEHALLNTTDLSVRVGLDNIDTFNRGSLIVDFYFYPNLSKKATDNKFSPDWGLMIYDEHIKKYKPAILQMFVRVYGEKDGKAVFNAVEIMIKKQKNLDAGKAYKNINGIQIFMHDGEYTLPMIELTLKK